MINNRTLAIAAVLALTVPAVGSAAPVYFNPITENLVEGHTVFAVLEVVDKTTREKNHFAAAVAVLVRENVAVRELQRFPGVLWFNDQYLVNPYDSDRRVQDIRYPCGGAVLAVNQGDPDPRVAIGPGTPAGGLLNVVTNDSFFPFNAAGEGDGFGTTEGDDFLSNGAYAGDNAWVNLETLSSDIPTSVLNYEESYLITDPNDHMWQIDVYLGTTRVTLPDGTLTAVQTGYVWVVNILGSPAFVPDKGDNCFPYEVLPNVVNSAIGDFNAGQSCGQKDPFDHGADTGTNQFNDDDMSPNTNNTRVSTPGAPLSSDPYGDDPCSDTSPSGKGYSSPSQNGFCYNGNPNTASAPCNGADPLPTQPVRLYNALLYFKLEHLTVAGANKDHSNDGDNTQTNGCQVYTEWACPGDNDDNEGFSHPFHPDPSGATANEAMPCGETFYRPGGERSNHGGSTTADSNVWYDGEARYNGRGYCDELHATRNIDLYFSGEARPFPPVTPNFVITDLEGSAAPYHCHTLDATNPDCDAAYYQ